MHAKYGRRVIARVACPNTSRTGWVLLLAAAMLGTPIIPAFAQVTQPPDPAAMASQVKKFGVGKSVKVWLVGGERVNGHIRTIRDDSFTLRVNRSTARSIPYAQVAEIKDPSALTWILVGAAIVVAIILIAHH